MSIAVEGLIKNIHLKLSIAINSKVIRACGRRDATEEWEAKPGAFT